MTSKAEKMDKQEEIEEEAEDWIKLYKAQMANQRNTYLEKLGFQKHPEPEPAMQIDKHFENEDYSINFFVVKSNDDIRRSYLDKLISTGVLKLEPSKKYQCIVIFDWDDTIMSTSFISSFDSLKTVTPQAKIQLNNLDVSASKLIERASQYGDLYIVTNAAKGWVQYSSKHYLPMTGAAMDKAKTIIISARSHYEVTYPGDFHRWKIEAFKSIKTKFQTHLITNLICVGDSNIQMDAAHSLGKEFSQSLVKTIKFRENPKPEELIKQQGLVSSKLKEIYDNPKNLTIKLQKKKKQEKQENQGQKQSIKQRKKSQATSSQQTSSKQKKQNSGIEKGNQKSTDDKSS